MDAPRADHGFHTHSLSNNTNKQRPSRSLRLSSLKRLARHKTVQNSASGSVISKQSSKIASTISRPSSSGSSESICTDKSVSSYGTQTDPSVLSNQCGEREDPSSVTQNAAVDNNSFARRVPDKNSSSTSNGALASPPSIAANTTTTSAISHSFPTSSSHNSLNSSSSKPAGILRMGSFTGSKKNLSIHNRSSSKISVETTTNYVHESSSETSLNSSISNETSSTSKSRSKKALFFRKQRKDKSNRLSTISTFAHSNNSQPSMIIHSGTEDSSRQHSALSYYSSYDEPEFSKSISFYHSAAIQHQTSYSNALDRHH